MAATFPLKKPSNLNDPKISEFILQKSEGILGEIVTLLRKAAIQAIYTKATINEMMFRMIDYHSLSEWRKTFERSLAEAS
ncbi:MAG: NTP-binding protein [Gammaproteobacteria bacterium]|nr:NTP-binding protein [Gammaproteobacteria bacterium]